MENEGELKVMQQSSGIAKRTPPAWLSHGFRPFFLLGASFAVIALGWWIAGFQGMVAPPPSAFDPLAWHRHEMLFGMIGAIIAGFLLTAVPNWTGSEALKGRRLGILVALWLAARLAVATGGITGPWLAALLDAGFLFVMAGWAWGRIRAAGNRNMPVPLLIGLLGLTALADHAGLVLGVERLADIGYRGGIAVILVLISLIGGRILPAFTRNWLEATGRGGPLPVTFNRFDGLTVLLTALALVAWAGLPETALAASLLLAAGALQSLRLLRWRGWRTSAEPLMAVLHLSYAWLPVGLLLLGGSLLGLALPATAALHALTAGAMGTMTLSVMTRAALGHTGRPLSAGAREIAIFALVHLGALGRVIGAAFPGQYLELLGVSALLWGGAFALFALSYAPLLLRASPRPA